MSLKPKVDFEDHMAMNSRIDKLSLDKFSPPISATQTLSDTKSRPQ